MARYYLAPALVQLRSEINAQWPGRDRTSDGWIGDTSHAARPSDHNPAPPTGVVRAIDVDKDGMDAARIIGAAIQDARVEYVIHAGLIYQRKYGFKPRRYTGINAHHGHVHISIRHASVYENSTARWLSTSLAASGTKVGNGLTLNGSLTYETTSTVTGDAPMSAAELSILRGEIAAVKAQVDAIADDYEVIFFRENTEAIYEAQIKAGTYYHVESTAALANRKAVLNGAGVRWKDWPTLAGRSGFGKEIV